MGLRVRKGALVLAIVAAAAAARGTVVDATLSLHGPHRVRPPSAKLGRALTETLDAHARASPPRTDDELLAFALRETARQLHFGLAHPTRLAFDGEEREAHCVEYAELFASIVNRMRGSIDAVAWVVRSDATLAGRPLASPAWRDHDWVRVVVRTASGSRHYDVDPTLYDVGLGWDVSRSVHGEVGVR